MAAYSTDDFFAAKAMMAGGMSARAAAARLEFLGG